MNISRKTISLLCVKCNAKGTASWSNAGITSNYRHYGLDHLSKGFRYIDRGDRAGSYFECVHCKAKAKEF